MTGDNNSLNKKSDLTRWNRAGLQRFRYIDGNAITYMETLRKKLVEQYSTDGELLWRELSSRFPEQNNETAYQSRKRLNGQYHDERRDYAWEILRTFSRSTHILGEYINAYANEAYLSTAVEWDNVRKLVAMLDYQPSPPASAQTHIALLYKEGKSGTIDKGFALKNKPGKGESTVIFESQEKLQGSAAINHLTLKDWNKNPQTLKIDRTRSINREGQKTTALSIKYYIENDIEAINAGDRGVISNSNKGHSIQVKAVASDAKGSYLRLSSSDYNLNDFNCYNSTLYLQADFISAPLPNGVDSAVLQEGTKLNNNEIIFTKYKKRYRARRISTSEQDSVQFNKSSHSAKKKETVYKARSISRQENSKIASGFLYIIPEDCVYSSVLFVNKRLKLVAKYSNIKEKKEAVSGVVAQHYISGDYGRTIYCPEEEPVDTLEKTGSSIVNEITFSGKASALESGQWCLAIHKDATKAVYQIVRITSDKDSFTVKLKNCNKAISELHSAFKQQIKHKDHSLNHSSLKGIAGTTTLQLENNDLGNELKLGQKLICAADNSAIRVEIKDLVKDTESLKLYVSPAFHNNKVFTLHNTLIYGNVVRATHGETQPEKIVGSGDASQTKQNFKLSSDKVSWLADAAFSSGVRADLSLRVGARIWQQVQDLSLSAAEDHHYSVKVNEDNSLSICFGDGRHGRRLPTGIDNIRVRLRNGYGEEGNLAARSLVKIARPHSLIDDFTAPLSATGGSEKESAENMRNSAPATVLALSRAVSLDDFSHLAGHHSMLWQAKAFEKIPDRPGRSKIEVVAVAAGGAVFHSESDTAKLIQNYLIAHAAPDTPVSVISYEPLFMQLKLSIMVDKQAFDKKQVTAAVEEYVQSQLILNKRKLGQPLFRSEIIALLEQVEGVENGHCDILSIIDEAGNSDNGAHLYCARDGKIRKVTIKPQQLLYLDAVRQPLQIVSLDYEP